MGAFNSQDGHRFEFQLISGCCDFVQDLKSPQLMPFGLSVGSRHLACKSAWYAFKSQMNTASPVNTDLDLVLAPLC